MPSGHAYAKALRTVKTCVGAEWCRFGVQDSTNMGIELEKDLWRMYAPHKVKLAVSGCPRNCAEAGIKDGGVIGGAKALTLTAVSDHTATTNAVAGASWPPDPLILARSRLLQVHPQAIAPQSPLEMPAHRQRQDPVLGLEHQAGTRTQRRDLVRALGAGEGADLQDQFLAALAGVENALGETLGRRSFGHILPDQPGKTENRAEQFVEIVRDATRKLA